MSNGSFLSAEALLQSNQVLLLFVLMPMEEDLAEGYVAEASL